MQIGSGLESGQGFGKVMEMFREACKKGNLELVKEVCELIDSAFYMKRFL